MAYGDLVSRVDFNMKRDSPFSYACHACNRCCRNKAIRVSPYEILRLARYLGISTTQFIANHTEAGGTVLRTNENGDCGFLGERGCSVHPDRPLACRIYPLARWVSPDGEESFGHLTPHPHTAGIYGTSGTVQDYLDHQQLAPFFEMSERYGKLYQAMVDLLEKLDPDELDRRPERRAAIDELPAGTLASMWVDIDLTIAHANMNSRDQHVSVEEAINIHIQSIEVWIQSAASNL
ncbi:YkgJ family cysteine cluster protein [Bradyrhizobium sp. 157]|uniref:YkgJ family cysteine cluster protein n=1 Tax=Bradyrhizobium sp. 157 TaxID=2782631 RepID=UPI001FFC28B8|nr:YkgJ family cysteine cluster protein [Bradyrhizobium sp. 157]MCK1641650.1 YkgJ family cysteine cluster protein [Bradyrhizobium sp. 157]